MKKTIFISVKIIVVLFSIFSMTACDNFSTSDSGVGSQPEPEPILPPIGPNLNGDTWAGQFKSVNGGAFIPITATITHSGNQVTIDTSIIDTMTAGRFSGVISSVGGLLLEDASDGEDWTTLFGASSVNSINLADFVFIDGQNTDTNIIILKR